MIRLDRTSVDKAIEGMNLFTATKEVLASYEAEKEALVKREEALTERLAQLQEQHIQLMMDREVATDNPSDYIYISKQLTNINEDVKVITLLQDQLKEDFTALKQKYMPIVRETYSKDSSARNKHFNVSEAVSYVREELKLVISDYEKAISEQDQQVMPLIYDDFLDDSELMNESWDNPDRRMKALAFKRTFDFDRNNLLYDKEIRLK
ncbi:hypothetical protein VSK70_26650 [Bacillus sp. WOD8 KX774193]|uniref:hypothetical protein n=2 Tax=Bacillaceae TaxID=186817 RepID=UPI000A35DC2F|nr:MULTISPECIES: hypothetical protein [Bacillus]MCU5032450.1 hypothetical protein [Bacillus cereus]MRA75560.1 hypothetical protein [Bacillus thuringiensis]MCR6463207.1 hypothetical protein [Bacillus paranthracis]MEC3859480.1 hypothetical protein [Bacillus sp. WOD8 KX774193]MRA94052.1 hypothetical protein [Bacillus thuringiensis]